MIKKAVKHLLNAIGVTTSRNGVETFITSKCPYIT